MADAFAVNGLLNGTPGTTDTALNLLWGLTRIMLNAGWTVTQSSNGTLFGAVDYWTSMPSAGGAWIVLTGPGGRQFCFHVNTTFDRWTGRIIYAKSGGFTFSGASATSPGTIPSTAVYARGSAAAFSSWFGGGTKAIKYGQIACKDVGDGSFWVLGSTPTTAAGTFYHAFGFFSLQPVDTNDPDPYAIYCSANTATTDATTSLSAHIGGGILTVGENGVTSGYWWAWSRNSSWRSFSPRYDYLSAVSGSADWNPYSSTYVLGALGLGKTETAYREHKGYFKYIRTFGVPGAAPGDTVNVGANPYYAIVGSNANSVPFAGFFWDGTTTSLLLN